MHARDQSLPDPIIPPIIQNIHRLKANAIAFDAQFTVNQLFTGNRLPSILKGMTIISRGMRFPNTYYATATEDQVIGINQY